MSKFSVKKPLTVFMTAIIVLILGFVAYTKMTPDLLPNIDFPYVVVMTSYPGATPEKVETVVTKPMEQSMATLENVENIQSVSSENASTLILEFNEDVNMDTISVDILQKINLIQGYWDDGVGTPVILKMNPSMLPVSVAAVSMEGMDQAALSDFVSDTLLNKLEGTAGVASITNTGVLEEQWNVVISQEKIDQANARIREGIDQQMEAASGAQTLDPAVAVQMMTVDQAIAYGFDVSNMTIEEALSNGINVLDVTLEEAREKGMTAIAETLEQAQAAKEQAYAQADLRKLVTMDLISNLLQAQNFSMPAGYVEQEGVSYLVSVGEELASQEEVENLLLMDPGIPGVEPVYLKDVADVFLSDNAGEIYAKINGEDGVILTFSKQSDYATAKTSSNIQEKFGSLEEEYPGLHFTTLMDQGDYIYMMIDSILENLFLGALFAVIILFLFLKDLRPTFITLCSIPISVVFAIVLMYFSGISLNIISMSGLAISVGMLVDNSVVVIENIYRLKSKGVSTVKAAISGAAQVAGAITASTLTTVCVFLPIVFVEGITRQLFVDLALTLAYSLVASLIIALTLVPAMASGMLKNVKEKKHGLFDVVLRGYRKLLKAALRFKPVVLLLAVGLLVFSVYASLQKGFSFMPDMNMPQLRISIEMPEGATFQETTQLSDQVMERVQSVEEVETVGAMIGGNLMMGMGNSGNSSITMYAMLKEKTERSSKEVGEAIEGLCQDLDCTVSASSSADSGSSSMLLGNGISIQVLGDDLDALARTAKEVAAILENVEGTQEVSDGIEETDPEIHFVVDKEAAVKEGLTVAQVYSELTKAMSAKKQAGSVTFDGKEYDVVVSSDAIEELTPEEVKNLIISVTDQEGNEKELELGSIARIDEKETMVSINRKNQERYLTVTAGIQDGYNVTLVTNEAKKALEDYHPENGIRLDFDGENETIMESMEQLVQMLLLGLVLVYMIMVAQFQSLKSPFIIMFTIPLAFTGGLLALLIADLEVSVIAMLGFIMLSGIIVNNGIVLVDYINQLRMDGWEKRKAIVEAGVTRMRPILMTSITTILGLSVMVLGIGGTDSGAEMMRPLAIVCIGGLTYATLLTLFVVPVLYDLMNRKKMRILAKEDLEITNE